MSDQIPIINEHHRGTRARRLAAGVCAQCGKNPLKTTYLCSGCADYFAEYAREKRQAKRAAFQAEHGIIDGRFKRKDTPIETERQCRMCKTYKPIDEFSWNDKLKARRKTICKPCDCKRADKWAKDHPDARAEIHRTRHLKRKYGLSRAQFDQMTADQNGLCAICNGPQQEGRGKNLCVDHCHGTNKIRQLLCHNCNTAIGALNDRPDILRRAADYIEKHEAKEIC